MITYCTHKFQNTGAAPPQEKFIRPSMAWRHCRRCTLFPKGNEYRKAATRDPGDDASAIRTVRLGVNGGAASCTRVSDLLVPSVARRNSRDLMRSTASLLIYLGKRYIDRSEFKIEDTAYPRTVHREIWRSRVSGDSIKLPRLNDKAIGQLKRCRNFPSESTPW